MLKFLVLIGLLALLFYMLGLKRARPPQAGRPEAPPPARPQAMVSCAECGLHLPQQDALPGRGGQFCSAAHRAAFEARNPPPA